MAKFTILSIAVFALVQISFGYKISEPAENVASLPGVIVEETARVLAIQWNMTKDILAENRIIENKKRAVKTEIKAATNDVKAKLADLDDQIRAAKKKGKEGANCATTAKNDRKAIDVKNISRCSKTFSFDILKANFGILGVLKGKLYSSIGTCSALHLLSDDGLRNCIEGEIEKDMNKYDDVKYEIESQAADIYTNAVNCVDETKADLKSNIKHISKALKKCIKNL